VVAILRRVTDGRIHLERETWEKAVEVADGFWIIATHHRPAFMKATPDVNNRCLIFRLRHDGRDVLLVLNGVDPRVIPEVRRVERDTGLKVEFIVSGGGGHHLFLPAWRDEFCEATVYVCPVRIPNTPSAKPLMSGSRVQLLDIDNPLPQFAGQLDAVLFHGLHGIRDTPTPFECGKEPGPLALVKNLVAIDYPIDELWLHHVATGTVIVGENLAWMVSKKSYDGFPFLVRTFMKPEAVYVQTQTRKVVDKATVEACWKRVTRWPSKTLIGYHEPVGEGFVGDGQKALIDAARAAKQMP
jgi:hypothetical protein